MASDIRSIPPEKSATRSPASRLKVLYLKQRSIGPTTGDFSGAEMAGEEANKISEPSANLDITRKRRILHIGGTPL